jgi:hypothetical protein
LCVQRQGATDEANAEQGRDKFGWLHVFSWTIKPD